MRILLGFNEAQRVYKGLGMQTVSGVRLQMLEFHSKGFRVEGLGFRVKGLGLRV